MKRFATITASVALLGALACSTMPPQKGALSSSLFGTVTLPGDTVPRGSTLLLVSLVEIPSDSILVQERILNLEEYPIKFTLNYDPNQVHEGKHYGISTALYVGEFLRYNNDPTTARVISDGFTQNVTIKLQRAN